MNLKLIIKKLSPDLFILLKDSYYGFIKIFFGKTRQEIIFTKIYKLNAWQDKESYSGSGSNLQNTVTIREELPKLIKELNAKTILDIPCGDFYWMNKIDLNILYTGMDIVSELIDLNNKKYGNETRKFFKADIINDDLPQNDIIFCRDCLPHLSFKNIFAALSRIKKSNSIYLITSTYINQTANKDFHTGGFRKLNFQLTPFNFPSPLKIINDKCTYGNIVYEDKSLAVWKISDLPVKL